MTVVTQVFCTAALHLYLMVISHLVLFFFSSQYDGIILPGK